MITMMLKLKVGENIVKAFPEKVALNLQPLLLVKDDLAIEGGIILRGFTLFIPSKFRKFIPVEHHSAHLGISVIKSLACSYV